MEMDFQEDAMVTKPHILVVSLPYAGHMNPMMQFAKRLASKGLQVTMLCPSFNRTQPQADNISIKTDHIFIQQCQQTPRDENGIEEIIERIVSDRLRKVVEEQKRCGHPIQVLIHDSLMPWGVDLGHQLGLRVGSFFVHGCITSAIYYLVFQGKFKLPVEEGSSVSSLPFTMPTMEAKDLPFHYHGELFPGNVDALVNQFVHVDKADWIFFSTFYELEIEAAKWLASQLQIMITGPSMPSMFLDKRLVDDRGYGLSLSKSDGEACTKWLDDKDTESVVYVSIGSLANIQKDYVHELAWGLLNSKHKFLWVVKDSEMDKLPNNFLHEAAEKGLVVNWCSQLDILAHRATGSFLTHCTWNSTIEALSLGVPMLVMPHGGSDQTTNAKCIVDLWHTGVRVYTLGIESITRESTAMSIKDVMEGTKREALKANAIKWNEMAMKAISEGGSSDKDIENFVSKLYPSTP